jgi:hypothetical protein
MLKLTLAALLVASSAPALACSIAPEGYDLEKALAVKGHTLNVFHGTIIAVHSKREGDRITFRSTVKVDTWFRGKPRPLVAMISVVEPADTSCSGINNFQSVGGDEVFIVAEQGVEHDAVQGLLSAVLARRGAKLDVAACAKGALGNVDADDIGPVGRCLASKYRRSALR